MPEDPRPPVAIRITRPYATEDEFLAQELETLSRTSVTLLGAQPRPQGIVLRFEVVLTSGQVLVRGEGRVVGFRPNVHQGLGGLSLRFTRLDSRSKMLIDKAATLREQRRPSAAPAPMPFEPAPSAPSLSIPDASPSGPALSIPDSSPTGATVQISDASPSGPALPIPEASPTTPTLATPEAESSPRSAEADFEAEEPTSKRSERPPAPKPVAPLAPPPEGGRDALLARLRSRAQSLDPIAVKGILEQRKARTSAAH